MMKKEEIENAKEQVKKAMGILKEMISMNQSIATEAWLSAFQIFNANVFSSLGFSYKEFVIVMKNGMKECKPMFPPED